MTHLANGPTVSLEEAQRIEQETAQHLFRSRKLSLIVDLDQTIVHATVDPTVGEWITEGEAWEARQAKKAAKDKAATEGGEGVATEQGGEAAGEQGGSEEHTGEEGTGEKGKTVDANTEDEVNPNWEALKDVKKFRLGPEALGQPHQRHKGRTKENHIEQEGCMYYIKPRCVRAPCIRAPEVYADAKPAPASWSSCTRCRPSMRCTFIRWVRVLTQRKSVPPSTLAARSSVTAYSVEMRVAVSAAFSLHLGCRANVLVRGLTQKSLQRLFPCDQSMVVIIDDRADVWEWSPNLVKVIPCKPTGYGSTS